MSEVDLLIVNYKTPHLLEDLLDTLSSDYVEGVHKVYIADNGSPDGGLSTTMLSRIRNEGGWKGMPVEGVYFNENVGYASAVNQMASKSKSDILCAVNADTWFTTSHVSQVISSFNETPNMAICGVKQMDQKFRIRHGGIFFDGVGNPIHRGWDSIDYRDVMYKDKVQCWTVSGSIYYVRRSAWEEMTNHIGFKEIFPECPGAFLPTPMYFEETFCSVFAAGLGYEVWYDGTVDTAGHHWHASAPVGSNTHWFDISSRIYRDTCAKLGLKNEFDKEVSS